MRTAHRMLVRNLDTQINEELPLNSFKLVETSGIRPKPHVIRDQQCAQAELKEEQLSAQVQQEAGVIGPSTPLGLNVWNYGVPNAFRAQSGPVASTGDFSGLSAMVKPFGQMTGARLATAAAAPPPLMSENLVESTIAEPLQKPQQLAHAQAVLGIQTGRGDVMVTSEFAQKSPEEAMLTGGEVFYCRFCASYFNSSDKWGEHCASDGHRFNIFSDRDRGWNFRQPPWHLNPDQYKLCVPHVGDPNNDGDPGIYRIEHIAAYEL